MDYLFVNLFTESISFVLYELVGLQQGENPAQKKDQARPLTRGGARGVFAPPPPHRPQRSAF